MFLLKFLASLWGDASRAWGAAVQGQEDKRPIVVPLGPRLDELNIVLDLFVLVSRVDLVLQAEHQPTGYFDQEIRTAVKGRPHLGANSRSPQLLLGHRERQAKLCEK